MNNMQQMPTSKQAPEKQPLVSIMIYNYNYGQYLRECFDSVLNQSYQNFEILFSDNASSDDSWEIALEYNRKYPERIFVARNRKNFGQHANQRNCHINIRGKYYLILGSDDVLHPEYLSKTIHMLEQHREAGFVIVHKSTIDEKGNITEEKPFYNQTCKIPAPKQAAVHMMASINPSVTQIVYRTQCTAETTMRATGIGTRYHGARILDFDIACEHAVIYIKEALVYHRVHGNNDGAHATDNLMDVLGSYVMNFDFAEKAASLELTEVAERLQPSIEKNAKLALRYAVSALSKHKETLAKRYFYLSFALFPSIEADALYQDLFTYWFSQEAKEAVFKKIISHNTQQSRQFSYAPPEDSINLE